MKNLKNRATVLLAGLACMVLSATAGADIIVNSFGMKYGGAPTGTVSYPGAVSNTIYAGEIRLNTSEGPVDAFCIDVTNVLRTGSYSQNPVDLNTSDRQWQLIGKLYDHYYAGANTGNTSAAFQLALWAIVNGTSTSQSTSFSGARTLADTWLGTLAGLESLGHYQFTVLDPLSPIANQRLLTAVAVPEPGTMALLGLGLLGAGAMRRRRSR